MEFIKNKLKSLILEHFLNLNSSNKINPTSKCLNTTHNPLTKIKFTSCLTNNMWTKKERKKNKAKREK